MAKNCYKYGKCKLRIAKEWDECPEDCQWYVPDWIVQEEDDAAAFARSEWDDIEEMFGLYEEE